MAEHVPMGDEDEGPAVGEDLSVPMWVWTLLGFALVTAVVIVVIIWGGGTSSNDAVAPADDAPAETLPAETLPAATTPAATQPA